MFPIIHFRTLYANLALVGAVGYMAACAAARPYWIKPEDTMHSDVESRERAIDRSHAVEKAAEAAKRAAKRAAKAAAKAAEAAKKAAEAAKKAAEAAKDAAEEADKWLEMVTKEAAEGGGSGGVKRHKNA